MFKISAANAQHVLHQAADALRESGQELAYQLEKRAEAEAELSRRDLDERVRRVAKSMDDKGLNDHLSFEEKVAELQRPENLTQLDALEKGAELAAQQVKLAHVDNSDAHGVSGTTNAAEAQFIAALSE
tara:strand:+ start:1181 stop:1567 length:387 start_codon:yes stop_codon:yes gene_type:complete